MDFAAKEAGDLTTDRKTQASTTIFAISTAVGLLERFKDNLLLIERNANAGVANPECDDFRAVTEHRMICTPAVSDRFDFECDPAAFGEFECVGKQIFEHLLQALGVGADCLWNAARALDKI